MRLIIVNNQVDIIGILRSRKYIRKVERIRLRDLSNLQDSIVGVNSGILRIIITEEHLIDYFFHNHILFRYFLLVTL